MTYIIAEAGVNHNGHLSIAHELIDEASKAGANAVKFQTFKAEKLVSLNTPKVPYQLKTSSPLESHYEMIKSLELSYEDHFKLKKHCDEIGLDFLSTPYDLDSAEFLQKNINVKFFKTASADIVDLPLQKYIATTGTPAIVSVGMASIEEIKIVDLIFQKHSKVKPTYLHCISNYPCTNESINLKIITTLKNLFNCPVGFSDHSLGSTASIMAIALGATIIEKHFTLDKRLKGPDHKASIEPNELKSLIEEIRICEAQLGCAEKNPQEEELKMRSISRKSLHYSEDFLKGHILSENDLVLLRPGTGLYYSKLNSIIGKKLLKNVFKNQILSMDELDNIT